MYDKSSLLIPIGSRYSFRQESEWLYSAQTPRPGEDAVLAPQSKNQKTGGVMTWVELRFLYFIWFEYHTDGCRAPTVVLPQILHPCFLVLILGDEYMVRD